MMGHNKKGYKELLMHRMFLAIVSNIVLQFFLISSLILITNINTNIISWLLDTWEIITSFRMWIYFFVFAFITFVQGVIYSKTYLHHPPYLKNRFVKLQNVFTGENLLKGTLYTSVGGCLVWLHLSLQKSNQNLLIRNCDIIYGSCLIEEHYFLLLSGLWTGLYFFIISLHNLRYFKFPIIPQTKFFQFRKGIYSMLPTVASTAFWPAIYFMIGYYFFGHYMRNFILSTASVQIETKPMDSISKLLDVSLILYLWLYQSIFILMNNAMSLVFEIFLTEWIPFDIQQNNVFEINNSVITLTDALSMESIPIIQHLGYLDLITLAQKQKERRNILFTLSQPGGHPYNWNCIIEKCLSIIKKFSDELNAITLKSKEQQFPSSSIISNLTASNITTCPSEYIYNMRNLVTEKIPSVDESCACKPIETENFIYKYIKTKWNMLITYFLSKPLIYYIFGEQEDNKVQYVLFQAQAVIWAAEAISALSVVSLKEDSYGVVQKDLPAIINMLLALKHSLDKLQKSNILTKKPQSSDRSVKKIISSLQSASKRSLYKITIGFEDYINDLTLDTTVMEHLQLFLKYKE